MEKTFLKIARTALLLVIATSLAVTAIAALYGVIQLFAPRKTTPSLGSIRLGDVVATSNVQSNPAGSSSPTGPTNQTGIRSIDPKCAAILPKFNRVIAEVGQKKSSPVLNPTSMQYENTTTVDYDLTASDQICSMFKSAIDEQNTKVAAYFPSLDLTDDYYANLSRFLDEVSLDNKRLRTLSPADPNRYDVVALLTGFNEKFGLAVDQIVDKATSDKEAAVAQKARGGIALYTAGSAFFFFFLCCLILVFIRIEVNTRELVEVVRASQPSTKADNRVDATSPSAGP